MALLQVSRDIGFTAITDRGPTPPFGRRQTGIGPKRTSIHAVPLIMTVTPARMHVATMGCSTASGESQLCLIACGVPQAPFKHIMSNLRSPLEVFRDMAPPAVWIGGRNTRGMQNTSIVALTFHGPFPCSGTCFCVTQHVSPLFPFCGTPKN